MNERPTGESTRQPVAAAGPRPTATRPGPAPSVEPRRPFTAPCLERLGAWRALTLQQSIPIGPGGD